MRLVYIFSLCLIVGIFFSQLLNLAPYNTLLIYLLNFCLSYIMMEVGLEFNMDKSNWRKCGKDYMVAALAAAAPWILCFLYFISFFSGPTWAEFLLVARFAAPTSSGILFSMLAAAGLASTWVFRKVQVLAIFDDVDTIILLIPLQLLLGRRNGEGALIITIVVMVALLYLAWRFLHQLRIPSSRPWLLLYSMLLATLIHLIHKGMHVELEILLPSFVFGALLHNPHNAKEHPEYRHEHDFIEAEKRSLMILDRSIKIAFMLLVGMILPKFDIGSSSYGMLTLHVIMLTILSNLGKCCPYFFYKDEATWKERVAVCIGMFPRGEMGAGVLAIAIAYGVKGYVTTVSALTIAVQLVMIGLFIKLITKLIKPEQNARKPV